MCFTLSPFKCIVQETWKIKKNAKEKQANPSVFLPYIDTTVNILVYFLLYLLSFSGAGGICTYVYMCTFMYAYMYVYCLSIHTCIYV